VCRGLEEERPGGRVVELMACVQGYCMGNNASDAIKAGAQISFHIKAAERDRR